MIFKLANAHQVVDLIINNFLKKDSICVDATLGNGKDSLKIYKTLEGECRIYAFDIQEKAIDNSKKLFIENNISLNKINFINDSHEFVDEYIKEEIDFFIMNLGYLPGGNKDITTNYKTVQIFLDKITSIMKDKSFGLIIFYPGHEAGKEELIKISEYLSGLDQKKFNVIKIEQINQMNQPPQVVMLERL